MSLPGFSAAKNSMGDEIAVIDEELIQQALAENQGDAGGAMNLAAAVTEAVTLRLSFKNVKKIANLTGFEHLTTLCLDNNVIDKICNIDHLVNLKWLDLSFNNIQKIEGLDKLTNLMDVSLFNNKISQIGGLDGCIDSLQCLSIGNNAISSLDGKLQGEVGLCHYLRKFKKLNLLNLEGNPVCKEAEYKYMLLAYLPNIKYLDYALIHEGEVTTAREQYQDELQEEEVSNGDGNGVAMRSLQRRSLCSVFFCRIIFFGLLLGLLSPHNQFLTHAPPPHTPTRAHPPLKSLRRTRRSWRRRQSVTPTRRASSRPSRTRT